MKAGACRTWGFEVRLERAAGADGRCAARRCRCAACRLRVVRAMPPGAQSRSARARCTPTPTLCMAKGKFEDAAKKFEDLDRDHPYAPEARRAIVMAAYAYYKAGKLPEAIASAERYTTLHPGTKDAALAHHIIAPAYFDEMKGPNRDQTATRKALGRAQDAEDALSRQPLRQAGRQPHPHRRGHARGVGDGSRPLLPRSAATTSPPSTASRRSSPTTRRRRTSRRR